MIWKVLEEIILASRQKCYIVGGFLRDIYLGKEIHDLDLVVETGALEFGRTLADRLGGSFVLLDDKRKTSRIVFPEENIVREIDLAQFQGDSLEEDMHSRDLTINALALPINIENLRLLTDLFAFNTNSPQWQQARQSLSASILDYCNGIADLRQQLVRLQSEQVILADPIRMLRAVRLAAQLEWSLDHQTKEWIARHVQLLTKVSSERIRDEVFTLLALPKTAEFITEVVLDLGILQVIWPEIKIMQDTDQNYHHAVNVWVHCLTTYQCIERILNSPQEFPEDIRYPLFEHLTKPIGRFPRQLPEIMKWTALFHDIGKPGTQGRKQDGRITFYGHDRVGGELISVMAQRLRLSNKEEFLARKLVSMHMRPLQMFNLKQLSRRAYYRLFRDVGNEAMEILVLALADMEAKLVFRGEQEDLVRYREYIFDLLRIYINRPETIFPHKIVSAQDLINMYPQLPHSAIRKVLGDIVMTQALGCISSKEELLAWVDTYMSKRYPEVTE